MVKKPFQVCSIVHEAYAREKGEVFIWEARAVSHPGINFIPERFNNRTVPSELALQKVHWSLATIPILKRKQLVASFLCQKILVKCHRYPSLKSMYKAILVSRFFHNIAALHPRNVFYLPFQFSLIHTSL